MNNWRGSVVIACAILLGSTAFFENVVIRGKAVFLGKA
jgi:hypothetical protein